MNKEFSKQIVELIRSNTDLFSDGGGRNGNERIVYFSKKILLLIKFLIQKKV